MIRGAIKQECSVIAWVPVQDLRFSRSRFRVINEQIVETANMWLINTSTLLLEDRKRIADAPYAILSHRWQDDEVTFQHMQQPLEQRQLLQGWAKLSAFCDLVHGMKYKYAWMDTCCINKDSMTELSEAINSMYRWYAESAICVAYLYDAGPNGCDFTDAEWFQRGWTLQELIAPKVVQFFDQDWTCIGEKTELLEQISLRTRIPESVLLDAHKVNQCSVAQRMSWAAERTTERVEDRAWSLLGLFDIHYMQPSYGGGEAAFVALQEEIIKRHADHSIFTWTMDPGMKYSGPFAKSPLAFKDCGKVQSAPCSEAFHLDNLGLSIRLQTRPFSMKTYICPLRAYEDGKWCAILLTEVPDVLQFVRSSDSNGTSKFTVGEQQQHFTTRDVRIALNVPDMGPSIYHGFWLRSLSPPGIASATVKILSKDENDNQDRIALPESHYGTAGVVLITQANGELSTRWSRLCWIKFGFNDNFEPVCLLTNHTYNAGSDAATFNKSLSPDADSQLRAKFLTRGWIKANAGEVPSIAAGWPTGRCLVTFEGNGGAIMLEALNLRLFDKYGS